LSDQLYGIVDLNLSVAMEPRYLSSMAAPSTNREGMSDAVTRLLDERKGGTG
jgi:hypothetical protein